MGRGDLGRRAHAAAGKASATYPMLSIEVDAPELSPLMALEEASRTSSLLGVGSGGSSALGALILGSVSRSVLHHAACPVAVVKLTAAGEGPRDDGVSLRAGSHTAQRTVGRADTTG